MLLNSVVPSLVEGSNALYESLEGYANIILGLLFLLAAQTSWRVWKFSIAPSMYPDEPKELPYRIPLIGTLGDRRMKPWNTDLPGHLFAFFGDSNALLTGAREYFGNTREPYSLTIAGLTTYVITKAEHVGEAYRNTKTLSYEQFVQSMMRILGNSEPAVDAMFTPLPKDKPGFPNPHGKPLGILFRQMHIHQLFPGSNLDFLEARFHEFFDANLTLENLQSTCGYATAKSPDSIVLPLTRWSSDYFVKGGQHAYFGPRLAEIDPSLTDHFLVFDELSYQVIYQYPTFLAREMKASRDRLIGAFRTYLDLPAAERSGDAWFVKAMETEMRAVGIAGDDMAIATLTIYWAINTNSRKAAFWLLAYILQTPGALEAARAETQAAFREDGSVDFKFLHDETPGLEAMWNEMLRLSAFAASVRFITEDTPLGGKTCKKGNRLIIPYRQLHMDRGVYGESVDQFDPERFRRDPKLATGNNFRPFGGGATMCPGRHVARRAVFLWVAMVLNRFDVELEGEQELMEADLRKPVPGLMSPKEGEDMYVRLTKRKA